MTASRRRGEVWLADLDNTRPVIVLTRNPMGRYLNAVLAALVTSTVRRVSTEVPVALPLVSGSIRSPTPTTRSSSPGPVYYGGSAAPLPKQ
jgi:hypothetical protein